MPEEPQTFDDERAQEARLNPREDHSEDHESTSPENKKSDDKSPVERLRDKKENLGQDVKNLAGAAEGNPVAIAKILKDPKKVIIGAIIGALGNPFTWIFALIIFLLVIIAGSDATVSIGKTAGLCKKIASVVLPQPISAKRSDSAYIQALENAEKTTGTSRLLIEAVDYQEHKLGTNDPGRDTNAVLIDIGNKLQEANYMRDSKGSLIKDDKGSYIKELPNITGIPTDNFAAAVALQNYHCVFIENKDLLAAEGLNGSRISQYCFKITQQECLKKAFANSWMVNPPVLASSSSVSSTVKSDDMGAFLFYLFVNKSKACPTSAGGSPGGLPPNCNISGLTPGGKAVCAAEQAAALQKPYIWGGPTECRGNWGSCPQLPQISGFDCSGLTGWAWFQAAGISIGNVTTTQLANIPNHPAVSDLQPGDLVFFGYGNVHVAIYKGAGKVIHAPQPGDVVREADLNGLAGYFDGGIIGTARPQ